MHLLSKLISVLEKFNERNYKSIEIELDNDTFLSLALEAHRQNITFNKLINNYLIDFFNKTKDMTDEEIDNLLIKKGKSKNVSIRTKKK